jgi:hypothetical protein
VRSGFGPARPAGLGGPDFGGVTLDLMPGRIWLITEGNRVTDVIFH